MSIFLSESISTFDLTKGNDVKLYNDASQNQEGTSGAFADIHDAILEAKHFIFIVGWSFHPYVHLKRDSAPKELSSLGALLIQQACTYANMVIAINTWNHAEVGMPDWQNDDGDKVLDLLTKKLWGANRLKGECDQAEIKRKRPKNLLWRASSRTAYDYSHHQKFIVLDSLGSENRRQITIFFGGIDLTKGRFDWSEHPILPKDDKSQGYLKYEVREKPNDYFFQFDDWRNPEFNDDRQMVRQPWHDIHARLVGPAAWDFLREFVGRWIGHPGNNAQGDYDREGSYNEKVLRAFSGLFNSEKFVQQWEPSKAKWMAQVYRSMTREHWGCGYGMERQITTPSQKGKRRKEFKWKVRGSAESSISEAYLKAIATAQSFIYIETQFLIGSGKHWNRKRVRNSIPESIVNKILERSKHNVPFHVYIVLPMFPEGNPIHPVSALPQRQFQWATIEYMIRTLHAKMGNSWRDYLSFYFLAKWNNMESIQIKGSRRERVNANKRYMIYVHSKFMIVDDLYLIIGSANLNERSLSGNRDTEIATGLWPVPGQYETCKKDVQEFRRQLWEEHLGSRMPPKWKEPESEVCVGSIQQTALENYARFCSGKKTDENGHLCMWKIKATSQGLEFPCVSLPSSPMCSGWGQHMPDGIFNQGQFDTRWQWLWIPKGESLITTISKRTRLAE